MVHTPTSDAYQFAGLLGMNPLGITTPFEEAIQSPLVHRGFAGIPKGGYLYLASAYSREPRKERVVKQNAEWLRDFGVRGFSAVSPIIMGHAMRVSWTHDEWMAWCAPLLGPCRALVVLPIGSPELSAGVRAEVCWAVERNVPVFWG